MGTDRLSQSVHQIGFVVQHVYPLKTLVVVGHGDVVQRHRCHVMVGERLLCQGLGDFAAAICSEVEAEDNVPGTDVAVDAFDLEGHHKLVCDVLVVMGLHAFHGRRMSLLNFSHQGLVRLCHALPAFVSIHGVVAAVYRGDLGLFALQVGFQIGEVSRAHLRRGVPAICEGMDDTVGHPCGLCRVHQRVQVGLLAVHPTT